MIDMFSNKDAVDFLKELPDNSVDLIFTDPPYNISQKVSISRRYKSGELKPINLDFGEWDYTFDPIPFLEQALRVINEDGSLIIWTSEELYITYSEWMRKHMNYKHMLVWEKANPVPRFAKTGYLSSIELLVWASKNPITQKNPNFTFLGQNEMHKVRRSPICMGNERLKRPDNGKPHPTQKPLSICRDIIRVHSKENGLVVDPFCGVGSIPAAAYLENRHFMGNDLDAVYVEMARNRISTADKA